MRLFIAMVLIASLLGCATSGALQSGEPLPDQLVLQVDQLIEEAVTHGGESFGASGPVYLLQTMPPEALPHLVTYLTDTRETRCYPYRLKAWQDPQPLKVNQLVATAITRVADHHFWIHTESKTYSLRNENSPEIMEAFRYTIARWWAKNQSLSMEDRKLIDLHDPIEHLNRFAALDWLKQQESVSHEARKELIERLDFIVREGWTSLTGEEAVRCAWLLARLDDFGSRTAVGKLCNKMANDNPSLSNVNSLRRIMSAHSAWANMGVREREQAVANIKALKDQWYSRPRKLPPYDMKRIDDAWNDCVVLRGEL